MNKIIVEEKYKFVPPHHGTVFPAILGTLLPWYVSHSHGVHAMEFQGVEKIAEALGQGRAVMLAPNHCRPVDPMIVAQGVRKAGSHVYTVASWHLFKQNAWQGFLLPRAGVFSIYREGMDREALKCCAAILSKGVRPLLIFPEGVINRTNDRVGEFLEGVGLIARMGAKQRGDGEVSVFPVALRYTFEGDLEKSILPVLAELEDRLSWGRQSGKTIRARIDNIAYALLCLKEIEYLGEAGTGDTEARIDRLTDKVLSAHEEEWLGGGRTGGVKSRVKTLRTAVMPTLLKEGTPEETRRMVWAVLHDVYLAQQLGNYSTSYFSRDASETQILETVEKFEEDLKDAVRINRPIRAKMTVCDALIASGDLRDAAGFVENIRTSVCSALDSDRGCRA